MRNSGSSLGNSAHEKFDPVVEATMNHVRSSYPQNEANSANLKKIKELVFKIVDQPSLFEPLAREIRAIHQCDAALDFLLNVLATEQKPAPPAIETYDTFDSTRKRTRSWTPTEDYRLIMGVHLCGDNNWSEVSEFVGGGRTRSQCSQRWCRVIDPRISKDHWSEEEEKQLIDIVQRIGDKSWIKVAAEMNGRSDVQCRYKYRKMMKEKTNGASSCSSSSPLTTGMTSPAPAKQPISYQAAKMNISQQNQKIYALPEANANIQQAQQFDQTNFSMFNAQAIQSAIMNYLGPQAGNSPAPSSTNQFQDQDSAQMSLTEEGQKPHMETIQHEHAAVLPKFENDNLFDFPLSLDSDKSLFDSQSIFNSSVWLDF